MPGTRGISRPGSWGAVGEIIPGAICLSRRSRAEVNIRECMDALPDYCYQQDGIGTDHRCVTSKRLSGFTRPQGRGTRTLSAISASRTAMAWASPRTTRRRLSGTTKLLSREIRNLRFSSARYTATAKACPRTTSLLTHGSVSPRQRVARNRSRQETTLPSLCPLKPFQRVKPRQRVYMPSSKRRKANSGYLSPVSNALTIAGTISFAQSCSIAPHLISFLLQLSVQKSARSRNTWGEPRHCAYLHPRDTQSTGCRQNGV
jgi:hypothetical protein